MAGMNLTGVPTVFDGLGMGLSQPLDPAELEKRKKKILGAGQSDAFQSATQFLFGERLNSAGTPRA